MIDEFIATIDEVLAAHNCAFYSDFEAKCIIVEAMSKLVHRAVTEATK